MTVLLLLSVSGTGSEWLSKILFSSGSMYFSVFHFFSGQILPVEQHPLEYILFASVFDLILAGKP